MQSSSTYYVLPKLQFESKPDAILVESCGRLESEMQQNGTHHCDSEDEDECEWAEADDDDGDAPVGQGRFVLLLRARPGLLVLQDWGGKWVCFYILRDHNRGRAQNLNFPMDRFEIWTAIELRKNYIVFLN